MGVMTAIVVGMAVSAIGSAVSMYGQYQQGKSAEAAAKFEANIANNNAKIADDNARIQSLANETALADKRRKNAIIQANTEAKYAKTGVAMSSASVMDTMIEEAGVLEEEAQIQSYEGRGRVQALKQRSTDYKSQSSLLRYKGKSAMQTARIGMVGTGISAVGSSISAGASGMALDSKFNT